jgi:hypothetical protein
MSFSAFGLVAPPLSSVESLGVADQQDRMSNTIGGCDADEVQKSHDVGRDRDRCNARNDRGDSDG